MKIYTVLIIIFMTYVSYAADNRRGVPKELFGVELGKVYELGANLEKTDNIPIKKFVYPQRDLDHIGMSTDFEPLKKYNDFKYYEKKPYPSAKYYVTPFYLSLLPVIPGNVTSPDQLINNPPTKWEVVSIGWDGTKAKISDVADNYFWAKKYCNKLKTDIDIKPEILDEYGSGFYTCAFVENNQILEVYNLGRNVRLLIDEKTLKQKRSALELLMNK